MAIDSKNCHSGGSESSTVSSHGYICDWLSEVNSYHKFQPSSPLESSENSAPSSPTDSTSSSEAPAPTTDTEIIEYLDKLELLKYPVSSPVKRALDDNAEEESPVEEANTNMIVSHTADPYVRAAKRQRLAPSTQEVPVKTDSCGSTSSSSSSSSSSGSSSDSEDEEKERASKYVGEMSVEMLEELTLESQLSPIRSEENYLDCPYNGESAGSPPSPPNNDNLFPNSEEVETRTGISFEKTSSCSSSYSDHTSLKPCPEDADPNSLSYLARNKQRNQFMHMFEHDLKRIDDVERCPGRFVMLKNSVHKLRYDIREDKKRKRELEARLHQATGGTASFLIAQSEANLAASPSSSFFSNEQASVTMSMNGYHRSGPDYDCPVTRSHAYANYNPSAADTYGSSGTNAMYYNQQYHLYSNKGNYSVQNMYGNSKPNSGYHQYGLQQSCYYYYPGYSNNSTSEGYASAVPSTPAFSAPASSSMDVASYPAVQVTTSAAEEVTAPSNTTVQNTTNFDIKSNYDFIIDEIDKQIYMSSGSESSSNSVSNSSSPSQFSNSSSTSSGSNFYYNDGYGASYSNPESYSNYYNTPESSSPTPNMTQETGDKSLNTESPVPLQANPCGRSSLLSSRNGFESVVYSSLLASLDS